MVKGNATIAMIISLGAVITAVAAPILYVAGIKEVNAVQDNRLTNLESNYTALSDKIDKQNDKLDALLIRQGINPEKISSK